MNEYVIYIIAALVGIIAGLSSHIIKKKRYYEYEFRAKRDRIDGLEKENRKFREANDQLHLLVAYEESLPPDCIPGEYCGACFFAKHMYVYEGYGHYNVYHHCTKNGSCPNFVEKGIGE